MTQRSRPQADNNATLAYIDSGPYSRDQWAERIYAVYTGDENTAGQRTQLRGVVPTFDNMLVVTNPAGVTIRVGTGAGISTGSLLFNSAAVDFTPDTPAIAARIDKVVICENNTNAVYTGAASGVILDFPTVLVDYDATPGIGPYAARLAILRGDDATGAATALVQTGNYWMIELARYTISNVPAVSVLTDYREFINSELIIGAVAAENTAIHDVLRLGVEVNDGVGAAGLGAAVRFRLENSAGTAEDAGQIAVRYTDAAAADETRLEVRLKANGSDNLAAVIESPTSASADGNARGAGAVDLQQTRGAVGQVASGIAAGIGAGINNTASGGYAYAVGYQNTASGEYAYAEGNQNTASGDYSHAEGNSNSASADYTHAEGSDNVANAQWAHVEGVSSTASALAAHAEGNNTTASDDYAHAEGVLTVASGQAAHAEGSETEASGDYSHAEGDTTTASGDYAHAEGAEGVASGNFTHTGGYYAAAAFYGQATRASGFFAALGDAQASVLTARRYIPVHVLSTFYELYLDGATPALMVIPASSAWLVEALVVGITQNAALQWAYHIIGMIERDNAGTTTVASTTTTALFESDNNYDAMLIADNVNEALLVSVAQNGIGGVSYAIRWMAQIRLTEVTFP